MEAMILKPKHPWWVLALLLVPTIYGPVAGHAQNQNQAAKPTAATPATQRPAQKAVASAAVATAADAGGKEAAAAFATSGVYVAPDMRSLADTAQLEVAVKSAAVPVKVAVVGTLPPSSKTVADMAESLHGQLNLQQGLMIVVCDRPRALGLFGGSLDEPALADIAARTAKTFDSEGYATGVTRVISLVSEENARRSSSARTLILFGIGLPAAALFWFLKQSRRAGRREASAARGVAEVEQGRLRTAAEKLAHELGEAIAHETDDGRRGRLHSALDGAQAALAVAGRPLAETLAAKEWDAVRAQLKATGEQLKRSQFVLAQARIAREAAEGAAKAGEQSSAPDEVVNIGEVVEEGTESDTETVAVAADDRDEASRSEDV